MSLHASTLTCVYALLVDGDIYNEVARELVPVSKLEGLEHWLDHMISGERVKMKATVSRETAVEVEVKLTKDQYQFQNESRYVQPSYGNNLKITRAQRFLVYP